MKITLITKEEHARLLEIFNEYPKLTFQNEGYQYIKKSELTDDELVKFKEVETLLRKTILGFKGFNNFKINRTKEIEIRFQYDWTADDNTNGLVPFTGVGYILLDELLNGFKEKENEKSHTI